MRPSAPAALGLLLVGLLLLPGETTQKPTPCQSCRELVDKFNQVGWRRGTRSQGRPALDPRPPYGPGSPQHGPARWSLPPVLSPQGMVDTAKKNFGGGNTAWEEKSLSKYEFRWAPALLRALGHSWEMCAGHAHPCTPAAAPHSPRHPGRWGQPAPAPSWVTGTDGPCSSVTCSLAWDPPTGPHWPVGFPATQQTWWWRPRLGTESHAHKLWLRLPLCLELWGPAGVRGFPGDPSLPSVTLRMRRPLTPHIPSSSSLCVAPKTPSHPQLVCLSRVFFTEVAHAQLRPSSQWGLRLPPRWVAC